MKIIKDFSEFIQKSKDKKKQSYIEAEFAKAKIEWLKLEVTNGYAECVFKTELTEKQELVVNKVMSKLFPQNWGFKDVVAKDETNGHR